MRVGTLSAVVAAAVLVAGCGGSSSGTSGGSSKSSTKSSKSSTTRSSTSTSTKTPTTPISFASGTNCLQLAGVSAKFAEALASETGSKFNETAAAADFQNLANAAPSAIRPDLQTVAKAFTTFAAAFKKSGYEIGKAPTAAQAAALQTAVAVFKEPNLKAAEAALRGWSKKNCP